MTAATTEEFRLRLLRLAYAVAPVETMARPVYVVFASESGILCSNSGTCWGMVGACTDILLRETIGARWAGRGWGSLLADPTDDTARTNGTFLHELAHICAGQLTVSNRDFPPGIAAVIQTELRQEFTTRRDTPARTVQTHGINFTRAILHLRDRAAGAGVEVPFNALSTQTQIHPSIFAHALRDELRTCRYWPFSRIMASALPKTFRKLWTRDREIIDKQQRQQSTEECPPAVVAA
ncbi:MAG: hypothetical protein ABSH20_10870 [Tepidisphaeraceae bacterium]|jgi:hypothetical protein